MSLRIRYKWWMDRLKHDLGRYLFFLGYFRALQLLADTSWCTRCLYRNMYSDPDSLQKLQEIVPEPRIIAEDLGEMILRFMPMGCCRFSRNEGFAFAFFATFTAPST